jgi:pimeloyl-ACP methyl ester carboxylesterase
VVIHGIHCLGIDEPRMMNFSRAAAESGFAVLTPQVSALADYHVDDASIATIGESAVWFDGRLGNGRVTVIGVSFAGGLSLLAARNPAYASHMRALVLMGAYEDLARVSRFLATSQQEFPDGRSVPYAAHDYGASVFVYAHLGQFFPPADLAVAHEALRDWLSEQPEKAKPLLDRLSPAGRATMEALLARRIDAVRPQILNAIEADRAELAALSPHGQIAGLRVPVFILHGADDNVIPPAESLWLEREVPRAVLREVLITSAFSHVDPTKQPGWYDGLRLVHFLGAVLRAAS